MTMNRSGPSPRPRRRRRAPRARPGRRAAGAHPGAGAAAREPDRPHPEPPLHRRGQDRRGRLRGRVPGQADRDRPRGGAEDPPPAQRARRDDRRALSARGGGVLEAARPAHRHDLRLRRDARRHPVPGDGAAARPGAAPPAKGRRTAGRDARAAHPGSGGGVADRGARQRNRSPRHEAGERVHRDRAAARTTSRCSTSASPR